MNCVKVASRKSMIIMSFVTLLSGASLFPSQGLAVPISEAPAVVFEESDGPTNTTEFNKVTVEEVSPSENVKPAAATIIVAGSDVGRGAVDISQPKDLAQKSKPKTSLLALIQNWNAKASSDIQTQEFKQHSAFAIFSIAPARKACGVYRPVQNDYIDKTTPCPSSSVY